MVSRRRGEIPPTALAHTQVDVDALRVEIGGSRPVLDLHGSYPEEVESQIDIFLTEQIEHINMVEIVHGIGKGRLKQAALNYLEQHPMVRRIIEKSGSCIVFLERD